MNATKRVVLVLGAGASYPYGFPLGSGLIDDIQKFAGNERELLERADLNVRLIPAFKEALAASEVDSIDRFLESQVQAGYEDFELLGKGLIALGLSRHENASSLHGRNEEAIASKRGQRWYRYLFGRLMEEAQPDAIFNNSHISIITFNYDRSLEFWILDTLRARYRWPLDRCRSVLQRLSIVHVHGSLGGSPSDEGDHRPYEPIGSGGALRACIDSIHIVHQVDPKIHQWIRARELLRQASAVVFLGFGYLRQNVERLAVTELCYERRTRSPFADSLGLATFTPLDYDRLHIPNTASIWGTSLGRSPSEIAEEVLPLLGLAPRHTDRLVSTDTLNWLTNNVGIIKT